LSLRFELQRVIAKAADEFDVDTRAHLLSPQSAALEAAAEGLDHVELLASVQPMLANDGNTYPAMPNIENFSGQLPATTRSGATVHVNTCNTHPVLGALALLNSHRAIYPLAFGGADGPDDWSLCDWADQCHRKRGVVVWCKPWEDVLHSGGEALLAAILGKVDAVELSSQLRKTQFLPQLYNLWNAGVLLPLVGCSGKRSNATALGAMRTITRGSTVMDAIRIGATSVTNGPIIELTRTSGLASASVRSVVPFERLELIADGVVVGVAEPLEPAPVWGATLNYEVPINTGWIAARCLGTASSALYPDARVFAHTSAAKSNDRSDATCVGVLRHHIQRTREWLTLEAQFEQPRRKEQHLARCDAALSALVARIATPHSAM